jgi:2-keto-3-deoxy-L-rhamnonate aldolase RhmA
MMREAGEAMTSGSRPRPIGRKIFQPGRLTIGVGISDLYSPRLVPVLASAGADYVFIDMEHTRFTLNDVAGFVDGAGGVEIPIIVRPPEVSRGYIQRLLDLGADGFFTPRIDNAEDAAAAVRFMKYPPIGERGDSGRIQRSPSPVRARDEANVNTVLIAIVETAAGVQNIDEICATPGVDGVSIGPADLSMSLGVPGDLENDAYQAAEQRILDSCRAHGMPFTIGTAPTIEDARRQRALGCFTLFVDDEIGLLTRALATYCSDLRPIATQTGPDRSDTTRAR